MIVNSSLLVLLAVFSIELMVAFLSIITGMLPLYAVLVIFGIICSILEGRI